MVQIIGKYERESEEGYENFLKELGVNFLLRKAATASTPKLEVSEDNGKWTFLTSTTLKSMSLCFNIGEEFAETTPDGRDVTCTVTREGDKFTSIQTAKNPDHKNTEVVREFNDAGMLQTMKILNSEVVCKQTFKRL